MAFTFLHCADLHLGSPFLGLSVRNEAAAARFASASREAFSALVDAAIEAQVAFVLIAGDVYDGEWRDTSIGLFFAREMGRLSRAGIPVYFIRGNHDAASEVTKAVTLPGNVVEFPTARAVTHRLPDLGVALHGRGFPQRDVQDDFALGYPKAVPGAFNIGLLHTSCTGRPGHDRYAPCTPAQLSAYGYDYWALGHVHDFEIVSRDPWIVYPGNLQGRSIRECGPKGAVFVDVEGGRVAAVRRIVVDRARFAEVALDLTGYGTEAEVVRAVEAAIAPHVRDAEGRPLALRVTFSGATDLHDRLTADHHRWNAEVEAAAQRLHEDVWLEKLRLVTTATSDAAGPALLDLAPLLDALMIDDDLKRQVQAELDQMTLVRHRDEDMQSILAEARDLLLARAREAR
jgi:exonuclease SbcD